MIDFINFRDFMGVVVVQWCNSLMGANQRGIVLDNLMNKMLPKGRISILFISYQHKKLYHPYAEVDLMGE